MAEEQRSNKEGYSDPGVLRIRKCSFNRTKVCDKHCIYRKTCVRAKNEPTPCEVCSSRHIYCHETCEVYGKWKKKHDERHAEERKAREKVIEQTSYMRDARQRMKTSRRNNGRRT